jgi:hypothetical protein
VIPLTLITDTLPEPGGSGYGLRATAPRANHISFCMDLSHKTSFSFNLKEYFLLSLLRFA